MEKDNTYKMTYKVIGWTWWGDTDYVVASLTDEVVDAVVKEIRKCGYCFGGDSHQYRDGCVPVLSTGGSCEMQHARVGRDYVYGFFRRRSFSA